MEKVQVKFLKTYGSGHDHIRDASGKLILNGAIYNHPEVAAFPPATAEALVKAGFAVLVEPEAA